MGRCGFLGFPSQHTAPSFPTWLGRNIPRSSFLSKPTWAPFSLLVFFWGLICLGTAWLQLSSMAQVHEPFVGWPVPDQHLEFAEWPGRSARPPADESGVPARKEAEPRYARGKGARFDHPPYEIRPSIQARWFQSLRLLPRLPSRRPLGGSCVFPIPLSGQSSVCPRNS